MVCEIFYFFFGIGIVSRGCVYALRDTVLNLTAI